MFRWLKIKLRHRAELRRAIEREAHVLRARHGSRAYEVAKQQAARPDLTTWGRAIKTGAVAALKKSQAAKD